MLQDIISLKHDMLRGSKRLTTVQATYDEAPCSVWYVLSRICSERELIHASCCCCVVFVIVVVVGVVVY